MPAQNRLKNETSPYLQQHADNPVDWYPWCEEALTLARNADKPILLSVGYSACHWCHVMAHESFENLETAKIMNDLFVNIKVDREERPDIDKIYQLAHQLLTQRPGGWPLTMFLTPDSHIPYFGGTYFPPQQRYNMPGFASILQQAAEYYKRQKDAISEHNAAFEDTILRIATPQNADQPDSTLVDLATREMTNDFDADHGGFGQAPKFPHATNLEFLLGRCFYSDEQMPKMIVSYSLESMAKGGIYDQIGGGFCRYSVDERWNIPHFEKMLYDNGPLLGLYARSWQVFHDPLFKQIVLDTAEWVIRDMQDPSGGYYSSLDADSEGHEGKFYVWDRSEVESLLGPSEYELVSLHFGLSRPANFEGAWHLYDAQALNEVATTLNYETDRADVLLRAARKKLFLHRAQRIHPHRDEKILTAWNALMIKGMASAGRIFNQPQMVDSAQSAFDFIHDTLWVNGRLLASYKDGKAHLNAYLDDYVYLIDAALELLQARWRTRDILWAQALAERLLEQFEDPSNGGFFFTSNDHERLIHRPKPMIEESTAAGNGVAASVLSRLGHILGNTDYLKAADRTLKASASSIRQIPSGHGALITALESTLHPYQTVVIRGAECELWKNAVLEDFHPGRICFAIPDDENGLPGQLAERVPGAVTTAYVCSGGACLAPVQTLSELEEILLDDGCPAMG